MTDDSVWLRRMARIMAVVWFVVSVLLTAIIRTPSAFLGLAIILVLCAMMLLVGIDRAGRIIGIGFFVIALILAIAAEMAGPVWPIDRSDLAKLAVSAGAAGMATLFWDKRRGAPAKSIEDLAGRIAFTGILLYGLVATVASIGTVTTPVGLVTLEALAALSDLAGEAWRWRLAIPAVFAMGTLLAGYVHPGWPQLLGGLASAGVRGMFVRPNWPVTVAGLGWLLICTLKRPGWKPTLIGLAFVLLVAWTARAFWMAIGVF